MAGSAETCGLLHRSNAVRRDLRQVGGGNHTKNRKRAMRQPHVSNLPFISNRLGPLPLREEAPGSGKNLPRTGD